MKDRVPLGIGLGVVAYSLFSIHDASNKWLVASLPTFEVLCVRSVTIVIACLLIGRARLVTRCLATPLKLPLLGRGALTLSAWLLYYTAARHMPLGQLTTLYFSAPIMTTLLAVPLLGEGITRSRGISLALGFAGVLLASDPFGLRLSWDVGLVLAAAAMWGYAIILMRQVARHESSLVLMFYQNVCFLAVTLPPTVLQWQMPDTRHLLVLASVGALGGTAQYLLFEGCRHAPAAVMATVEYTALVWAFALGWLIFGDLPSLPVTLGAALIASAGLFLYVSERRAARSG